MKQEGMEALLRKQREQTQTMLNIFLFLYVSDRGGGMKVLYEARQKKCLKKYQKP